MSQFTSGGGGGVGVTAVIQGALTPRIDNVDIPLANTEVAFALPANTKRFYIKLRSGQPAMKVAYSAGTSGTTYVTVHPGNWYGEESLSSNSLTLYFQATAAAQVAEIISWI